MSKTPFVRAVSELMATHWAGKNLNDIDNEVAGVLLAAHQYCMGRVNPPPPPHVCSPFMLTLASLSMSQRRGDKFPADPALPSSA